MIMLTQINFNLQITYEKCIISKSIIVSNLMFMTGVFMYFNILHVLD